jgi:CRP/FNR family transcriptional regulator, cyclic AMP receptor protein
MHLEPSAFVADPQLIEALVSKSSCITFGADHVLFRQGDAPTGLYILHQGEVTLSMTSPNGEVVESFKADPGSLLGLPGLIGNEPYTLTAVACKGARLCFIDRDDFTGMMNTNPMLALKMLQVLAAEVRSARRALADL